MRVITTLCVHDSLDFFLLCRMICSFLRFLIFSNFGVVSIAWWPRAYVGADDCPCFFLCFLILSIHSSTWQPLCLIMFAIVRRLSKSASVKSVMAEPFRPARPVRPVNHQRMKNGESIFFITNSNNSNNGNNLPILWI